jgi:hypothetical protein
LSSDWWRRNCVPRNRRKITLLGIIIAALVGITAFVYVATMPRSASSCDPIIGTASYVMETGYSYVCGNGHATDGRLDIAVHNYHFAQTKNIQFRFSPNEQAPLPDEVFMLANVTVTNVGGGNSSMGGGWFSWIFNGSAPVTNSMFIANATFPNIYPNQTIPDDNGGLYLPPGSKTDLWIFFYVRFIPVLSSNIVQASNFILQFTIFNEDSYGGTYLGQGQYDCRKIVCEKPNVELIIRW